MLLRVGDYLNPRIAALRRCDPELPRAMRGDSDDLGTAAVAQFPAPAVIIRKDSVFNRFGLALPADRWTEEAARLLAAAGCGASLADAAAGAEIAARLLFGGITAVKNAAVRNPKTAITAMLVAGLAGWYCHRRGWITGAHLRAAVQQAASAARPFAQRVAAADARCNEARAALTVVEGLNRLLWKNDAPGTLARLKKAMTPAELAAMLSLSGPAVTAAEVGDVLAAHPAFTRGGEGDFFISRPADVRAITGGMQRQTRPPARSWAQRPAAPALSSPSGCRSPRLCESAHDERVGLADAEQDPLDHFRACIPRARPLVGTIEVISVLARAPVRRMASRRRTGVFGQAPRTGRGSVAAGCRLPLARPTVYGEVQELGARTTARGG